MKPIDRRVKKLPSESLTNSVQSWALPNVAGEHVMAFARKEGGPVEVVEEELVAEKLTLNELEEIRESARRDGFEEGYKDGLEKGLGDGHAKGLVDGRKEGHDAGYNSGLAEVQKLQATLADMIRQQHQPLAETVENLESQLLDMVVSLSQAVVGVSAEMDKGLVRQAVRDVIDRIPRPHDDLRVLVNPAEVEIVTDMARARHETWQVIGDDSIEPGGCLLRGVDSFADNTLTHRFEQVVAQFRAYRDIPVEDTAGKEQ